MKLVNNKLIPFLIFCIFLSIQVSTGLRILGLFPLQGKSHFMMCEALMRGLAERGHQVDVYSHFPLKSHIPNYTDYSLAGSIYAVQNNMSYDFIKNIASSFSPSKLMEVTKEVCELMNLPIFQNLLNNPPNDPPYDMVIIEVFVMQCYLAWGRHLNKPMVLVSTTPLTESMKDSLGNPINLAAEPNLFLGYTTPMTFVGRVKNVVFTTFIKHFFNYHLQSQDKIVEKIFGPGYPNVIELQKDISLALVNAHHALNGIKPFTPAVIPVGGLHIIDNEQKLPKEVKRFLDESKNGFVYVSFGSMARIETFPKPVLDAFYQTFEKIKPVRVLMKIAKPEELPPGLPSNVITYHWLPQVKVLKHKNIKVFVTHGGMMSTQESVYFGVPMIGFPLFGDQHSNIDMYSKRKLAIKLDYNDITESVLTKAITEIIKNPIYKSSAEKVGQLFQDNPMPPMDTAVYWVEYVAKYGKHALRSPVIDMPWWQASLLDVYAFIISSILLGLYVTKILLKKFIKIVYPKKPDAPKLKKNQ